MRIKARSYRSLIGEHTARTKAYKQFRRQSKLISQSLASQLDVNPIPIPTMLQCDCNFICTVCNRFVRKGEPAYNNVCQNCWDK